VGLSNRRILEGCDGSIQLQTGGKRSVWLKMDEFFRRFALHILPNGELRVT
jgi:hypothetical protein